MSGRRKNINIGHILRRFINPAICQACGIPVSADKQFCEHCERSFNRVKNPCHSCGLPNPVSGTLCPACMKSPPRWNRMRAPFVFCDPLRQQVHRLKFAHQPHIAHPLIEQSLSCFSTTNIDALIPVPLHPERLRERGFNQSQIIADALGSALNLPVDRQSLVRVKATDPQSGLSYRQRSVNIKRAFEYKPRTQWQSVALVDDIITTGNTMNEICKLLRQQCVTHIEVWALARALKHDS
jgi:ComF family protein